MDLFGCACCKETPTASEDVVVSGAASKIEAQSAFAEVPPGPQPFTIEIHAASLVRSFAKIGNMDPFAIVKVDGQEVFRTQVHKASHKEPRWTDATWTRHGAPEQIVIEIWDKNNYHKNVFCGNVEIPCANDMGEMEDFDFHLNKRDKETGTVLVTLRCGQQSRRPVAPSGGEFDNLHHAMENPCTLMAAEKSMRLMPAAHPEGADDDPGEADAISTAADAPVRLKTVTAVGAVSQQMTGMLGSWKCVSTFGLDEFLKATGVNAFQRRFAAAARWPTWEFQADGDALLFINHSALGDLKESIVFNTEYVNKDGRGNPNTCYAKWKGDNTEGLLEISRKMSMGNFVEYRELQGDNLSFRLDNGQVVWGRTFERES